mmetsp:Transcript_85560/g.215647  ORF Transcript_85560/g.215647 Transcript_85560/m.215647 type:complete len:206 (-) Transcript_85560:91-708(-)
MVAHRLGGSSHPPLGREERADRLLASRAFGGADVQTASGAAAATSAAALGANHATAPGVRQPPATAARRQTNVPSAARSSGGTSRASRQGAPPRPSSSCSAGKRSPQPGVANIHTLSSGSGGACGSRLHQTTEAYRQQRGTTARTVEQVGRATMTQEKAAEVDRAREKVLGRPSSATSGSGQGQRGSRTPARSVSRPGTGRRLGS